jgi:hypothetical protein
MLRPFRKGSAGNPGGVPSRYHEAMRIARENSAEAMLTLVAHLKDPDGRVAVTVANLLLERAFGRAREFKEDQQREAHVDLTSLTASELAILVKLADSGRLGGVPTDVPQDQAAAPVIEMEPSDVH